MTHDVPTEPSDWTFLPLRELDSLLRCPICKEYFDNTMIIPHCSHNFCSLCIRRFLQNKRQCPICSKSASESELRCNRLLDQLVQSFTKNRQSFLDLLTRSTHSPIIQTETIAQPCSEGFKVPLPPTMSQLPEFDEESQFQNVFNPPAAPHTETRKDMPPSTCMPPPTRPTTTASLIYRPNLIKRSDPVASDNADMEEPIVGDSESCFIVESSGVNTSVSAPPMDISGLSTPGSSQCSVRSSITVESMERKRAAATPSPSTGAETNRKLKVPCPVCNKQIQQTFINSHLDTCLNRTPSLSNKPHPSNHTLSDTKPSQPLRKLPNFVVSAMKDKELRTRLKKYGMSTQGARHVLGERLKEFTLRYNAQCDSANPKSMKEIASEVEKAERTMAAVNRRGSSSSESIASRRKSTADPVEIEQQNRAHEKAHADQYAKLVAQARESRNRATSDKSRSPSDEPADVALHNQTTPPLSPVLVGTQRPSTTPAASTHSARRAALFTGTTSTPLQSTSTNTPKSTRLLTTPTTRSLTTKIAPNTRSNHGSEHTPNGVSRLGINSFDDLSPLNEDFELWDEVGDSDSTPELESAVKDGEVLAPDSPEHKTSIHEPLCGRESTTVPESPGVLPTARGLRSTSKRKHDNSKIRHTIPEDDYEDFDLSPPIYRKKQRIA